MYIERLYYFCLTCFVVRLYVYNRVVMLIICNFTGCILREQSAPAESSHCLPQQEDREGPVMLCKTYCMYTCAVCTLYMKKLKVTKSACIM